MHVAQKPKVCGTYAAANWAWSVECLWMLLWYLLSTLFRCSLTSGMARLRSLSKFAAALMTVVRHPDLSAAAFSNSFGSRLAHFTVGMTSDCVTQYIINKLRNGKIQILFLFTCYSIIPLTRILVL